MDGVDLAIKFFELLRPYIIAGLVLLGAIFALILWERKDRILPLLFSRKKKTEGQWGDDTRADDTMLTRVFHRQEVLMNRMMDVIDRNTEAWSAAKDVNSQILDELRDCRSACGVLHKRVDEVLKGHAAGA
jgi:hypothetical protein